MHQHAQRDGAVDTAAGDDDLRARVQRLLDGGGAQVGVGAEQALGQGCAGLQFFDAFFAQMLGSAAAHHRPPPPRYLNRHALLCGDGGQRGGAGVGVHAAGVADDFDVFGHHVFEDGFHGDRDKVSRITQLRVFQAGGGEDGHGELGQIVKHHVIDLAQLHQLRRAHAAVAPEAGSATDTYGYVNGFFADLPLKTPAKIGFA